MVGRDSGEWCVQGEDEEASFEKRNVLELTMEDM